MISMILISGVAQADREQGAKDRPSRVHAWITPRDGQAPPLGSHSDLRVRRPLMISGTATFGAAYVASVVGAFVVPTVCPANSLLIRSILPIADTAACPEINPWLGVIPLLGPMLIWQQAGGDLGLPLLATAVQSVGLGLMIASLVFKQEVWVLDTQSGTTVGFTPSGVAMHF